MPITLSDEEFLKLWKSEDDRADTSDLQFYEAFEQKKSVFGTYVQFESSTRFMDFINFEMPELLGKQSAVFRGLSSARYRLFNNAQRSYVEILMNVTTTFRRKLTTHSGRN